ncbi:MAG: hypothetical protein U0234_22880 [Sandaracinus sp.]
MTILLRVIALRVIALRVIARPHLHSVGPDHRGVFRLTKRPRF